MSETKEARRAERKARRLERREARRLRKTEARAVRLGRKLDPRIPADLLEIEALAEAASMETRELIAAADYVDNGGKVDWIARLGEIARTILRHVEISDDTIDELGDALNRCIDIPGVPEWAEGYAIGAILDALWGAVDEALESA